MTHLRGAPRHPRTRGPDARPGRGAQDRAPAPEPQERSSGKRSPGPLRDPPHPARAPPPARRPRGAARRPRRAHRPRPAPRGPSRPRPGRRLPRAAARRSPPSAPGPSAGPPTPGACSPTREPPDLTPRRTKPPLPRRPAGPESSDDGQRRPRSRHRSRTSPTCAVGLPRSMALMVGWDRPIWVARSAWESRSARRRARIARPISSGERRGSDAGGGEEAMASVRSTSVDERGDRRPDGRVLQRSLIAWAASFPSDAPFGAFRGRSLRRSVRPAAHAIARSSQTQAGDAQEGPRASGPGGAKGAISITPPCSRRAVPSSRPRAGAGSERTPGAPPGRSGSLVGGRGVGRRLHADAGPASHGPRRPVGRGRGGSVRAGSWPGSGGSAA